MAKKRSKQDDANERAVDVASLPQELRARELGFRERVSLNKLARQKEHEAWARRLCLGFVAVTGVAALAFLALQFVVSEEKKGQLQMLAVFGLLWAGLSWTFGTRAKNRLGALAKLEEVVRDRLGR